MVSNDIWGNFCSTNPLKTINQINKDLLELLLVVNKCSFISCIREVFIISMKTFSKTKCYRIIIPKQKQHGRKHRF